MISALPDDLRARAVSVLAALTGEGRDRVDVVSMSSAVGGGSLPGDTLESFGLILAAGRPAALAARLRAGDPAIVGRVEGGAVLLDLRTIDPADDAALGAAVGRALGVAAAKG
jgi:L-seryl-tRNA(Ser) seleniumtransferase